MITSSVFLLVMGFLTRALVAGLFETVRVVDTHRAKNKRLIQK